MAEFYYFSKFDMFRPGKKNKLQKKKVSALALINIDYEIEMKMDSVCKLYLDKHPKRTE